MIITYSGEGKFEIKTRQAKILTGDKIKINDFEIPGSGEYEIGEIQTEVIDGITIFRSEGISLSYLDKRKKAIEEKELERMSDIDILFIPVGGGEVFDAKEASAAIAEIEPKIVVPMHYKDIAQFTKVEGATGEPQDSLKISKDSLPEDERQVIVLKNKTQ